MNNFDTPEKIASIDNAIEYVLKDNNIGWKDKKLYSWNWTDNREIFPGVRMSFHSGVVTFYDTNDYAIQEVKTKILVPGKISDKDLSDYVRPILIKLRRTGLPDTPENNGFIMNLNVSLFSCGVNNGNYVISTLKPDTRIDKEQNLRSAIGKWYTLL
ncbi:MAG: hypothetical protein ACP5NW_05195 [Candidatus Woesearchaeota archaeon]